MLTKHYTAWIDVEDKLPWENGSYLVVSKYMTLPDMYFDLANYSINKNEWITRAGGHVRFWMALPSPPENNGQE